MNHMDAKLVYEFDWPFGTDHFKWIFFTIESFFLEKLKVILRKVTYLMTLIYFSVAFNN